MPRHTSSVLSVLTLLAVGAIGWVMGRRSAPRRDTAAELWQAAEAIATGPGRAGPDAEDVASHTRRLAQAKADEVAARRREGSPEDREHRSERPAVGLDVTRLQSMANSLEPVVQYLTYIQNRRGDDSSLLFIRYDDIDAMAELDGEPSPDLLERLDQLGVVVSSN